MVIEIRNSISDRSTAPWNAARATSIIVSRPLIEGRLKSDTLRRRSNYSSAEMAWANRVACCCSRHLKPANGIRGNTYDWSRGTLESYRRVPAPYLVELANGHACVSVVVRVSVRLSSTMRYGNRGKHESTGPNDRERSARERRYPRRGKLSGFRS